jgi:hypothetical protein
MGLAAATGLAGDDDTNSDETKPAPKSSGIPWSPVIVKMFHLDEQKPPPKKPAPKKAAKKSTSNKLPAEEPTTERAREEAALMRRLQVCDKLMEIADRTHDMELRHRAEALDERARALYNQRTAHLRGSQASLDEKALDKFLDQSTAAPAATSAAPVALPSTDRASREGTKEVNR